jgi:hypothetical protein
MYIFSLSQILNMKEKNRERERERGSKLEQSWEGTSAQVMSMSTKIYRFVAPFKPLANQLKDNESYNSPWLLKPSNF